MKTCREWFVDTIWGKVAMVSWGNPHNPPVLMLHGFLDTAATFIPLLEQLPDTYYYVSFDNPGHGKSDPYPIGPLANQLTLIEVIHRVVTHMGWDKFIVFSHSMGFINAMFYHAVYAGKITSLVALDALPAISNYNVIQDVPDSWYDYFYSSYYSNYFRINEKPLRLNRETALSIVMKNRHINREQAEVLTSRALRHVEGDMYEFTYQNMVRKLSQFPVFNDTLKHAIVSNPPRTLHLIAIHRRDNFGRKLSSNIMEELDKDKRHSVVLVDGAHDVHVASPHLLVPYIVDFLEHDELNKIKSKL